MTSETIIEEIIEEIINNIIKKKKKINYYGFYPMTSY